MLACNQARGSGRAASRAVTHRALVLGLLLLPTGGLAQHQRACERGTWSEPVPVFPDSSGLFSPSLVFRKGQGFLAGNARFSTDLTELGVRVSRLDGTPLPSPAGDGALFAFPIAGFNSLGQLTLFWAEPRPDLDVPPRMGERLARIYHSVFVGEDSKTVINGRRIFWSVSEPIYSYDEIIWRGAREAKVVAAPDGTLHLAFSTRFRGTVHLRMRYSRDPAERRRQVTEFFEDAVYVDLALGPNGEVYLPYIAPLSTPGQQGFDTNSVLFRRSLDGGDSWERPVLVSQSGNAPAHYVRLATTPSGDLHLVWLKNLSGDPLSEAVWHSLSNDGGRSWGEPREIAAPAGNPHGLRIAVDRSGAVHAVFVSVNDSPYDKLYHVRWDRGAWSTPCVVDPDFPMADGAPALATDEEGRVHLVWSRGPRVWDRSSQAAGSGDSDPVAVRSVLLSRTSSNRP